MLGAMSGSAMVIKQLLTLQCIYIRFP